MLRLRLGGFDGELGEVIESEGGWMIHGMNLGGY